MTSQNQWNLATPMRNTALWLVNSQSDDEDNCLSAFILRLFTFNFQVKNDGNKSWCNYSLFIYSLLIQIQDGICPLPLLTNETCLWYNVNDLKLCKTCMNALPMARTRLALGLGLRLFVRFTTVTRFLELYIRPKIHQVSFYSLHTTVTRNKLIL
jgi:hypothetical protein